MSEQTAQEPTMEEILASIRRIISEDDTPEEASPSEEGEGVEASEPAAAAPEPEPVEAAEPEPEPEPEVEPEPVAAQVEAEEEVLELTERVEPVGDLDFMTPSESEDAGEPQLEAEPEPQPEPEPAVAMEALVSAATATAATTAFGKLSDAVAMPKEWLTLDSVVRELLRPLLKEWLDANLPDIVQTAVAEEVERIARARR